MVRATPKLNAKITIQIKKTHTEEYRVAASTPIVHLDSTFTEKFHIICCCHLNYYYSLTDLNISSLPCVHADIQIAHNRLVLGIHTA